MSTSAKQHVIEQKQEQQRRLKALKIRAARYGINAPPEVSVEIEDLQKGIGMLETIEHTAGLIDTIRQRLSILVKQQKHYGAAAPAHIQSEISGARKEIAHLKAVCAQNGHSVIDHPVDADEPEIETPPHFQSFPPAPLARIRQQLRAAIAMQRAGQYDDALAQLLYLQRELETLA